jgi:activator of 2-hydroxyglutaryl-CoA dehydratase
MFTIGIDKGSRSAKCVIMDDGQLLTYGRVETGPESTMAAYATMDAAIHRRTEHWGENRMQLPNVRTNHLILVPTSLRTIRND